MRRVLYAMWVASLCLVGACSRPTGDGLTPSATALRNDAGWAQYLAEHSAGVISSRDPIRIRFVSDAIDSAEVGKPIAGLIESTPAFEASAVFNNPRELVVLPNQPLQSGQRYQLRLIGGKLRSLPPALGDYHFAVQVIAQALDVQFQAIDIDPQNPQALRLKGLLSTADVADADAVEQALTARLGETAIKLRWQHNADGRRHAFETESLARAEQSRQLQLNWNGAAIGGEGAGERQIEIPALAEFSVARVGFALDGQQALVVDFSDRLAPKQDLNGLISLSSGEFSSRIEGNRLWVFPAKLGGGEVSLGLSAAIRSADGRRLGHEFKHSLMFETQRPGVRFVGSGSILPAAEHLSIPFEAINVASVQVTAFRVYDSNLGQFLQVNALGGSAELKRVGRYLWKKTIALGDGRLNEWRRFAFDVSELYRKEPGALYRFTLSIHRGNSLYACAEQDRAVPLPPDPLPDNGDEYDETQSSGWDGIEDYYGSPQFSWQDRDNPCKDGYYQLNPVAKDSRNFIAANIGLLVKADSDQRLHLVATDIRSGEPMAGARLRLYNYQNQEIGSALSNSQGLATIEPEVKPFYVAAEFGDQRGYLKLSDGLALPVSHFDVGGVSVEHGIKGTLYAERGVWRPGDVLHLTFVLRDPNDAIPAAHPAQIELINPQGQVVYSQTNSKPVGDFYRFDVATADSDPTGNWRARVSLGGRQFERMVKIETIMPNRLKIELDTGDRLKKAEQAELKLFSQWLHGASAAGLKADVSVKLKPRPTRFSRNTEFVFDDPTRTFKGEEQTLWQGELDAEGRARIDATLVADSPASGFLSADFTTRVFEPGGAFSMAGQNAAFHPYAHYVGIKLPKGDLSRGMLLTDTQHTVEIASLDSDGKPVSLPSVELSVYKLEWRWWWEKGGDGLANFAEGNANVLLQQEGVATENGSGRWQFEIKYPEWGRYLVRACDRKGGHCAAQVVYLDWPGWAGRAADQSGPGANALSLSSDKPQYTVGETAQIQLPPASRGRALLSIENGSGILSQQWLGLDGKRERFELPITAAMAPNVYLSVTLLQPHQDKQNDRPIRLYGVIPLLVSDPATHLQPEIKVAEEVRPETDMQIVVSESHGRAMTYTLAVVDEGLLGLTDFKTPQLHAEFYRREALGVRTWDMFDDVVGAYGGALEKLLALGGSDDGEHNDANRERKRFPPVVRFIGPFQLAAGKQAEHAIALPPYIGAVRVMLVAGQAGAYGSADRSVRVRQPLMVQATLPRVLGPGESLAMPISTFVLDENIHQVDVRAEVEPPLAIVGSDRLNLKFERTGDQLGFIALKVGDALGKTRVRVVAESGREQVEQLIDIEVRAPNPASSLVQKQVVPAGADWHSDIAPFGLDGTQQVSLEVSSVPPLNLSDRLHYLVQYPHGCVEQTTSAAFPQLYLHRLLKLDPGEQRRVQQHVQVAIERLRQFQQVGGGFGYWPGAVEWNSWSSSYVGHFLLEARRMGFAVPTPALNNWINFQKARAQVWLAADAHAALDQAYRLYTLALAGAPELGAMNRLREQKSLPNVARWLLAASYRQAGLSDVAQQLVAKADLSLPSYADEGPTFGSNLRDQAILLESMAGLGDAFRAKDLAEQIADALTNQGWYSTHSTAWSLLALAHFIGDRPQADFAFDYAMNKGDWQAQRSEQPIMQLKLPTDSATQRFDFRNRSSGPLYLQVVSRGVPAAGAEKAGDSSLKLSMSFTDALGHPLDPAALPQGQDLRARVTIKNDAARELSNLALAQIAPSGWEIINTRNAATASTISESAYDYRDFRDDRVYTYFGLKPGESRTYVLQFNAAYPGRYYLPSWSVEAMYDASRYARSGGRWVEVKR